MVRVLAEERLLVDTGPFCRFVENGRLAEMVAFLGDRLEITLDVRVELQRRARSDAAHAGLDDLNGEPFFDNARSLTPEQQRDADMIRKGNKELGDHAAKNLGEITTVVLARDRRDHLVIIDDGGGVKLARANGLVVVNTTHLVAEMVAEGALADEVGLPIFRSVFGGSEQTFQQLVARY